MPSLLHEALLMLFRNRPELAPELLRDALHVPLPRYSEVRIASAELAELLPTEYRADLVVLLIDGKPALGIVVEVQLRRDDQKRMSWPVYVVGLRARIECPTCLLVVTPSEAVATWAKTPIELGPGARLVPFVVGPSSVPIVTDSAEATRDPELAVLSAMAHGKGDPSVATSIAKAALGGLERLDLDDERAMLYLDLIVHSLGDATRAALEALMRSGTYQYQSDFAKKYFSEGMAKGLAEGVAKGRALAVLHVLRARNVATNEEQRERILGCGDVAVIERWLEHAVTVTSAEQLFDD